MSCYVARSAHVHQYKVCSSINLILKSNFTGFQQVALFLNTKWKTVHIQYKLLGNRAACTAQLWTAVCSHNADLYE